MLASQNVVVEVIVIDDGSKDSTSQVVERAFGGDSRTGHAWLASSADAAYTEVRDVLGLDVDTPEDLLLAEAAAPEALHVD